MRYLSLNEMLELHRRVMEQSGGALGIHSLSGLGAAMEVFLILNGFELEAGVDKQERVILQVASGEMKREEFTEWLRAKIVTNGLYLFVPRRNISVRS